MKVPEWYGYYYPGDLDRATQEQKKFFRYFSSKLNQNKYVEVEGILAYIFAYLYKVLEKDDVDEILEELQKIKNHYGMYPKIDSYCNSWISDCYFLKRAYKKAYQYDSRIIKYGNSPLVDYTLYKLAGNDMDIGYLIEVFFKFNKLTDYGKRNINQVKQELEGIFIEYEKINKTDIVKQCMYVKRNTEYPLLSGYKKIKVTRWYIDVEKFNSILPDADIEAENRLRVKSGIPRIGEGWISETQLYYEIKEAFSEYSVLQHGKPNFLGLQHLDVYIPQLKIGIEFQGLQHDKAIEYFGGEEAFQKNLERDKKKEQLCKANGVDVIYVWPGYDINQVIDTIRNCCSEKQLDINYRFLNSKDSQAINDNLVKKVGKAIKIENEHKKSDPFKITGKRSEISDTQATFKGKRLLQAVEEYKDRNDIINLHITYMQLINFYYTNRDKFDYLNSCISTCIKDIKLLDDCREKYINVVVNNKNVLEIDYEGYKNLGEREDLQSFLGTFPYTRLAIIYEKQGRFSDALSLCEDAVRYEISDYEKNEYAKRISRLQSKLNNVDKIL